MKQLTVGMLDKLIKQVESYEYVHNKNLHKILLKCNITYYNVYKRFELLNVLYPANLTKDEFIEQIAYIVNNMKQEELDYDKLQIQYITPLFNNVYSKLNTQEAILKWTKLLKHYDLFNEKSVKLIASRIPALNNEKQYIDDFNNIFNSFSIEDNNTIKIINKAKLYLKNTAAQKEKKQTIATPLF